MLARRRRKVRSSALDKATSGLVPLSLVWPLRLFMGFTFVYAGLQHLTDPSYFDPSKAGYIGHLISQYAIGSPIHDFLLGVVAPNAVSFGWMVAVGEVLIGIATLTGFLFRFAASAGLMLNFTFFLSATWSAFPFYFGSDIVFVMCWLTLLLTGPQVGQSVDGVLATRFHSLSWLVTKPVYRFATSEGPRPDEAVVVPLARRASLYPRQVNEVNKAFDRIKQQFVSHRETVTILEFVRAFVISLGVDRTDTPRLLNGIQTLVNRKGVDGP
jgi:thiosulfate dehydrogenase [quinone] large subunit